VDEAVHPVSGAEPEEVTGRVVDLAVEVGDAVRAEPDRIADLRLRSDAQGLREPRPGPLLADLRAPERDRDRATSAEPLDVLDELGQVCRVAVLQRVVLDLPVVPRQETAVDEPQPGRPAAASLELEREDVEPEKIALPNAAS
jgi:hypothetical protein